MYKIVDIFTLLIYLILSEKFKIRTSILLIVNVYISVTLIEYKIIYQKKFEEEKQKINYSTEIDLKKYIAQNSHFSIFYLTMRYMIMALLESNGATNGARNNSIYNIIIDFSLVDELQQI